MRSLRNNSVTGSYGNVNSGNINYGNYTGIYKFDPVPSYMMGPNGSTTTTSATLNNSNGNKVVVTNFSGSGKFNMSNVKSNLPVVVEARNNVPVGARLNLSETRRANGSLGASAQLHPNDYEMIQWYNSLPTRFNMTGSKRSHTR